MSESFFKTVPIRIPKKLTSKLKATYSPPKTDERLPCYKSHTLGVIIGPRGSGKSHACTDLLMRMKRVNCLDKVFIISPTIQSNLNFYLPLADEEDMYEEPSDDVLSEILGKIDVYAREMKEYVQSYRRFEESESVEDMLHNDVMLLEKYGYMEPIPHPSVAIVLDDVVGSSLMSQKSKLRNIAIRHRHLSGIGCHMYILSQSWHGINKTIRSNANLVLMFRFANDSQIKDFKSEMMGTLHLSNDEFDELYEYCTQDHDFMCIDLSKTPFIIKRNLNEIILVNGKKKEGRRKAHET